jgi:murein DD-endopeptidase MepM/ murein hydrolase activator NlpD
VIRWALVAAAALSAALGGGTALAGVSVRDGVPGGGFQRPVEGAFLSLGFGCTSLAFEPVNRACPGGHWHSGVDLACARGTPVRATLAGTVEVFDTASGYGLHVIIDHAGGLASLYGHLESVSVSSGEAVGAGSVIGLVGTSGTSTGPHLHFEIRRDGIAEDPRLDISLR